MFALLFVLFLVVPIAELAVILLIGQQIGPWWTIALLIADSIFGSWLARHEGIGAWRRFRTALESSRVPTREIADGALILLAGALMLTPGFLTDIVGILLLLPPTRAVIRRYLLAYVARRTAKRAAARFGVSGPSRTGTERRSAFGAGRGRVIDGQAEVHDPGRSSTEARWGEPERSEPEPDRRI